jgi:hypothetical protein
MKIDKNFVFYLFVSGLGILLTILFQLTAIVLFNKSDYGKFSAINMAFTVIALAFSTVPWTLQRTAITVLKESRNVQHFRYFGKTNQLAQFERNILKISFYASSIILITLTVLFIFYEKRAIGYASLAIFLPASALISIGFGRLQIAGNLLKLNVYSSLLAGVRLIPLLLLIFMELDPVIVLYLIAIIFFVYGDFLNSRVNSKNVNHNYEVGMQPYYSLIVNLFFWTLMSLDLLTVRLSFTAESASSYSLVGNLVRFGAIPVFYIVQTYFHSNGSLQNGIPTDFRRLIYRISVYWLLFSISLLTLINFTQQLFPFSSFVDLLNEADQLPIRYLLMSYFLIVSIPLSQLILTRVGKLDLIWVLVMICGNILVTFFLINSHTQLVVLQLATCLVFLFYIYSQYIFVWKKR